MNFIVYESKTSTERREKNRIFPTKYSKVFFFLSYFRTNKMDGVEQSSQVLTHFCVYRNAKQRQNKEISHSKLNASEWDM